MGKKLFLTMFVIAVVSGCKVVVIVPEGGRVISESGAHVCNAGESCEISVVDFFFDETFVAEPDEDHNFIHWKKAKKYFCGNSVSACRLRTNSFEGKQSLIDVLESDLKFYVSPIFLENGGFSNEPASLCFNPASYKVGTSISTEYRTTLFSDYLATAAILEIHQEDKSLVEGLEDFNDRRALKTSVTSRQSWRFLSDAFPIGDQLYDIYGESYANTNTANFRITQIGSILTSDTITPGGAGFGFDKTYTEVRWEPGSLTRFDVMAGESYFYRNTSFTHSETWRGAEHDVKDYDSSAEVEVFYRGVEPVTVPAGTFRACRFDSWGTAINPNEEPSAQRPGIAWYAVGSGVLVKSGNRGADGASVMELLSASINGEQVTGIEE